MFLTRRDIEAIRPLEWELREFNGSLYYTLTAESQTRLFWYDFVRNVFAPRFAKQLAFTRILNFDQTQPVLINDKLELRLPPALETVVYFAENSRPPVRFVIPVSQNVVLGAALVAVAVVGGLALVSAAQNSGTSMRSRNRQ